MVWQKLVEVDGRRLVLESKSGKRWELWDDSVFMDPGFDVKEAVKVLEEGEEVGRNGSRKQKAKSLNTLRDYTQLR